MELTEQERLRRATECIRMFLRDKPQLNRLLRGQPESTDTEIRVALMMALDDWNNTGPPIGNTTLGKHPAKYLLILRASASLLQSAATWHAREHMPSSDGGTSGDDHAKTADYLNIADRWIQEYEAKKIEIKERININEAFGNMSASSEYGWWFVYGQEYAW
jgi:hypothetical protein